MHNVCVHICTRRIQYGKCRAVGEKQCVSLSLLLTLALSRSVCLNVCVCVAVYVCVCSRRRKHGKCGAVGESTAVYCKRRGYASCSFTRYHQQCVAVWCREVPCDAVCCSVLVNQRLYIANFGEHTSCSFKRDHQQCAAPCCRVVQRVAGKCRAVGE